MPIPEFVADLRAHIGTDPLWLIGCTAVVVRQTDGVDEVLCVRRADNGAWTAVTGIVDPGEHPSVAAIREVAEETSIIAEVQRLAQVGVTPMMSYTNGDRSQYLDLAYRCRYTSGDPHPADGENSEVRWYPVADLPPMTPHMRARIEAALSDEIAPRTVLLETD